MSLPIPPELSSLLCKVKGWPNWFPTSFYPWKFWSLRRAQAWDVEMIFLKVLTQNDVVCTDSRNSHCVSSLWSPKVDNALCKWKVAPTIYHVPVLLPGSRMVNQSDSSLPLRSLKASGEAGSKHRHKPSHEWDICSTSMLTRSKPGNVCMIRWGQRRLSDRENREWESWPRVEAE